LPDRPPPYGDLDLMRTVAIVKVPAGATFSYDGADADFRFRPDLDHLNFAGLDPGTAFGSLGGDRSRQLDVTPVNDGLAADAFFGYAGGQIQLLQRMIPAMLTVDSRAVRLDCLGYLMRRVGPDGRSTSERGKPQACEKIKICLRSIATPPPSILMLPRPPMNGSDFIPSKLDYLGFSENFTMIPVGLAPSSSCRASVLISR